MNKLPFKILGITKNKYIYTVTYLGTIYRFKIVNISPHKLLNIAQLDFWIANSSCMGTNHMNKNAWEEMFDWVLHIAKSKGIFNADILN